MMVFESLALCKLMRLLLITKLHNNTIDLLYKILKKLYLKREKGKNGYEKGDVKMLMQEIR